MKQICLAFLVITLLFSCDCTFSENDTPHHLEGNYILKNVSSDSCIYDDENEWNGMFDFIFQKNERDRLPQANLTISPEGSFIMKIYFLDDGNAQKYPPLEYRGYLAKGEINEKGNEYGCIKQPLNEECSDIVISVKDNVVIWNWDLNETCNSLLTWELE